MFDLMSELTDQHKNSSRI